MVDGMKIGSVIMDLASEFGGNCELTKHGETVNFKSKKIIDHKMVSLCIIELYLTLGTFLWLLYLEAEHHFDPINPSGSKHNYVK